jgi:hypothetical protein
LHSSASALVLRSGSSALILSALLAGAACTPPAGSASVRPAPVSPAAAQRPTFDGERAFQALKAQCAFGARVPGTEAHRRCRDYMASEMRRSADRVVLQDFTYERLPMTNVIGLFNERARRQVLLCAHWDCRPFADEEINPAKRRMPVMGANDGASGVAVLLELARILKAQPPPVGVVLALFDGEDYGDFMADRGVFLGSRHFARRMKDVCSPAYGILLDMVGDRDLQIHREGISERRAGWVNDLVLGVARELGHQRKLVDSVRHTVTDDHVAINDAGVPCVDLIDFDYAYWHTVEDTPDKCSAASLKVVGDTLAEVIYREKDATAPRR